MRVVRQVITPIIKGLLRILCRIDDAELARVPDRGPLIVVTNHVNFLEVPLLYTHLLPRPVTGFAKAENWDNLFLRTLLFRMWGGIPLHRGEPDVSALRRALKALEDGAILGVAPEGTRSGHGRLQRGRPGVVWLAMYSGAPLLPVVFYGGEHFWRNLARLRRTDFHIIVGNPFYLDLDGVKPTRQVRHQIIDEIMYQIAALLPPAYRGAYSDLTAASETYLRFPPGMESNLRRASTHSAG
jgi:1-acyl-sn-glycerol-3-phosphate acyltransferase